MRPLHLHRERVAQADHKAQELRRWVRQPVVAMAGDQPTQPAGPRWVVRRVAAVVEGLQVQLM